MNALTTHWQIVREALANEKERLGRDIRIEETAFLPAALEVVERPVSPTGRLTVWVMLAGMAVLLLWLALGRIDIIASAGGVAWTGLPAGTVMGHVHLHVGDLAAAEEFFHAGLGFDKMVWEFRGALFLSAGGYHHHLATNTWSRGPSAADDEARLLAWDLVVPGRDDADAVARSLHEHGGSPSMIDHGWIVKDPWGTPVRVVVG